MPRPYLSVQDALSVEGTEATLRLLDLPPAWVVVLVILPLFAGIAWLGYARETIGGGLRALLTVLRVSAFLLLGIVLARPVFVEQREEVRPAEVVVLIDDSASMQRRDAYTGDDATREGIRAATGQQADAATRLDLARGFVETTLAPVLAEGDYRQSLYGFSQRAVPQESLEALAGRGPGTHLGDALLQIMATQRGKPVTDVVLLSDGRSNGGVEVLEAARSAGATGIPVHTIVVGDTRPERNAVVELVEAPTDALEGDELAVTVRVSVRGKTDADALYVSLEELDPEGRAEPVPLSEERVQVSESGERVVLVAPAALRLGERRFRVSLPPLEDETLVDDNAIEFSVQVSPARMRVLYVDGYPRWEYRYLKNLLLRADRLMDVQVFLLSATPDFPQESSPNLQPLREVPTTRTELLDNYDVILLGDVNPGAISPDPARCEEFLRAVREFVEAGGGLMLQAGEWSNPQAYRNTPLEDLLPVVLDPVGVLKFEGDATTEFRPQLESPLQPHEVLRLHPDADTNRALWEDPSGLRGFYWYAPVKRAKPGAQVLLRHPVDKDRETGEAYPLLVTGYFPAGRVMFLAIDSTWMWRYHYGDRYHEVFWRNAIRWLALGRLKSSDRRHRLEASRSTYDLEERITLEARVLDADFQPSDQATQAISWVGPDERVQQLDLQLVEGRGGVYRGTLQVDRTGVYRAWIEADGQRVSTTEFEVLLPSRENADPSPNPAQLALISSRTGGRYLQLAEAAELRKEFPGGEERREPISSSLEDAWDDATTLLLALGLLSVEWILRKRAELV